MTNALDIGRAALLLVDLQRDVLHPKGAVARQGLSGLDPASGAHLIAAWQELADTVRAAGRPVVWVNTEFRRDYLDAAVAARWLDARRGAPGGFLVQGS